MGLREAFAARRKRLLERLERKPAFALAKASVQAFSADNGTRLSAALAFYGLFSLAPLIVVATAIAGLAFGDAAAEGELTATLEGVIGEDAARVVESMVASADRPGAGVAASAVSVLFLLWGASRVFAELDAGLNVVWGDRNARPPGIKATLKARLLAFLFVLLTGFLLVLFLAGGAAVSTLAAHLGDELPGGPLPWVTLHLTVSLTVATLLFAVLFRYLTPAHVPWRDAWVGGTVTAVLFDVGLFLTSQYLARSATTSTYGAAGSVIALLLWLWVSAAVLYVGAEFTHEYARRRTLPGDASA